MKSLIKNGYKAKKRPSGHDISKKFTNDNGGAIPPNLLEIANTESNSQYLRRCRELGIKPHPARYPAALVEFFTEFLTEQEDIVYDPFAGSNVTGAVCEQSNRRWLASETEERYLDSSLARFERDQSLFDSTASKPHKKSRTKKTKKTHKKGSARKKG
jgi:site-specific DNA-methyltransferase (cytosine-N4-specific)